MIERDLEDFEEINNVIAIDLAIVKNYLTYNESPNDYHINEYIERLVDHIEDLPGLIKELVREV